MSNMVNNMGRQMVAAFSALFSWQFCQHLAYANPTGGSVGQGSAIFNTSGSQLTITTSANTFINWQSFNIGAGETTTFVEPSASSVVWNQIDGSSPSQILGNLNANGYVILQNQAGFYVGGQASISAHGLIMTTSSSPAPNFSGGGAWEFDAPPPTAKIVNYGKINVGGGPAFLIAGDIENDGTISAPGGQIGLYAGEKVLVSTSPDGRGLSAQVTLPKGSVDNNGKLIADAGDISLQAQTVNQNGFIQANSVQDVNGTIELLASDAVNLGANSTISAQGGSTGTSAGGDVTIKSGGTFADQMGSTVDISGGAQGGNGGTVEISAPEISSIQTAINGQAVNGFTDGILNLDPENIDLVSSVPNLTGGNQAGTSGEYSSGTVGSTDSPTGAGDILYLNVNSFASTLSQINLQADNDIELSTLWNLADPGTTAKLSLTAGNDIILDNNAGINAGNNWSVSLSAGSGFISTPSQSTPASGNDGIYLLGNSYIQTQNGNINLTAANQMVVNWNSDQPNGDTSFNLKVDVTTLAGSVVDVLNSGGVGNNGIRTLNGGDISVDTHYGDIITGGNNQGFTYSSTAPYFSTSPNLGGISTAHGGDVDINAGGDVISYAPVGTTDVSMEGDAGSGAFGLQPGNVTVTAGGSIYGHYVLVNGVGNIDAGVNAGEASGADPFALSLVDGIWNVDANNGNIYLQEVRNPNGVFNTAPASGGLHPLPNAGYHLFDYAPDATVNLDAGIGVYLTGNSIPRPDGSVQVLYPPILDINAGFGGVTLENDVTLFPSIYQNLDINTTGNLIGLQSTPGVNPQLLMSDSSKSTWSTSTAGTAFNEADNGSVLPVDSSSLAEINVAGSVETIDLILDKAAQIHVGGDMIDCGFSGQNLDASQTTSITVTGGIYNQTAYSFVNLAQLIPNLPASDILPGYADAWNSIFLLAVNPAIATTPIPSIYLPSQYAGYALTAFSLFGASQVNGQLVNTGPILGFVYNPTTGQLGYDAELAGHLTTALINELSGPITILKLGANGVPLTYTVTNPDGSQSTYFQTQTVYWGGASQTAISALAGSLSELQQENQSAATSLAIGYTIGGPGQFNVNASYIDLGDSYGILSCATLNVLGKDYGNRFADLASITPSGDGAAVNVTVTGDLVMDNSTIASLGGGDVNVSTPGGSMNLGSPYLNNAATALAYGIYTADGGNVSLDSLGDIDIAGSRVGTLDGGNVSVTSEDGDVNVGSGGDTQNNVDVSYINPVTGQATFYPDTFFGSGIIAYTLVPPSPGEVSVGYVRPPGYATVPGNISVTTLRGDINASLAGIQQEALDGTVTAGPTINLTAGSPSYIGNINLGEFGVIGGTINAYASGNIVGVIISRQNSNVQAQQNFVGTLLAGGNADVSAGGSVGGTIIGGAGVSVSGGGEISAQVLGQNVSVNGGTAQSTLGSTAAASSTSQAASQQANSQAQQQVADDTAGQGDDTDDKKKKKPGLLQRIKRVTVILPKSV